MTTELKFAVLIDADNTSFEYFKTVFDLIANEGVATIRRIYGDWSNEKLKNYKNYILEYSLTPEQQFENTTGKNSTDMAIAIEAMDILLKGNVDGFCIVSSDSDFTRLASRLRESGKKVIGMGRKQTPKPFINACNEFKFLDISEPPLAEEPKKENSKAKKGKSDKEKGQSQASSDKIKEIPEATTEKQGLTPVEEITEAINKTIEEKSDADGWMLASQLGEIMIKKHPDFDPKHYGYKKLADLLDGLGFVTKKERNPNNTANPNGKELYVKSTNS